jgi:hypothetical protein
MGFVLAIVGGIIFVLLGLAAIGNGIRLLLFILLVKGIEISSFSFKREQTCKKYI